MPDVSLVLVVTTFLAGVLMFLAPCTFPLVPPFLAYISGPKGESVRRISLIQNAVAFCSGFSLIFILLGLSAGVIGASIQPFIAVFNFIVGVMIFLLGASLLGWLSFTGIHRSIGFPLPSFLVPGSVVSSFLVGLLFAVGFSPCIGPVMATVLLVASSEGSGLVGALLLAVFSLGLSIPFILTAAFYGAVQSWFLSTSRLVKYVERVTGVLLLCIGILFMIGGHQYLYAVGETLFYFVGLDFLFAYY